MRYSKSAGTFFPEEIDYPALPNDLIAVSDADFNAALNRHPLAAIDVIDGKLIIQTPASRQILEREKAIQADKVRSSCRQAIIGGFKSAALGDERTYPSDITDQTNLAAAVTSSLLAAGESEWSVACWCMDFSGNWARVQHNAAQIQQVYRDWIATFDRHQTNNHRLQDQITKAKSTKSVQAIVF